jgi:hypothetical protein
VKRETTNNDKDGSQRAYDDFHTLFASIETDIKAKNPEAQEHIEAAMHEVRDSIQTGNLTEAATASQELVNEVNDASNELADAETEEALPTAGGSMTIALLTLAGAALAMVAIGALVRRRTTNLLR